MAGDDRGPWAPPPTPLRGERATQRGPGIGGVEWWRRSDQGAAPGDPPQVVGPGAARIAVRRRLWRVWQLGQAGAIGGALLDWEGPPRWRPAGWLVMGTAVAITALVNLGLVTWSRLPATDKRRLAIEALVMAAFTALVASAMMLAY